MESALCPPTEPDFRLIETLGYRSGEGFARLDRHLARMARSAQALNIPFDRSAAELRLQAVAGDDPLRCRLTLEADGQFGLTTGALTETPSVWRVAVAPERLDSGNFWLRHKTTRRALYDEVRANLRDGIDEMIFLNERGEVCEGTITNIFAVMADGKMLTPALSAGLLPGILREELLVKREVSEAILTLNDLREAQSILAGNSLRGLIRVEMATS